MNEASSKYVDQIATEKLIQEKLKNVHHSPDPSGEQADTGFDDFARLPQEPEEIEESVAGGVAGLTFRSFVRTKDPENNRVKTRCYRAAHPVGELIFVHGLYEDNLLLYGSFFSEVNGRGLNVHLMTLPYHYDRKPGRSLFSGEFFWSGDIHRSVQAYKQAVIDLYQLHGYLRRRSGGPVWIVGFSMGGGIALSLAARANLDGVFIINPVCNIGTLVWTSALFATIRADLETGGMTLDDVKARCSACEPLHAAQNRTSTDGIVLGRSLYDQINDPANYDLLIETWKITRVLTYKAGHLNVLRVPKLAADIAHSCLRKA
jgi:alpha/beta superfamily hydrolase